MKLVSMTWPEYLAGVCRLDGHLRRLTFQEADVLLALLLSSPDRLTQAGDLIENIWNPEREPRNAEKIIRTEVHFLRRHGVPIESKMGWGYRIPRSARGRPGAMKLAA